MVSQLEDRRITHMELVGFRFMLLAWATAIVIGLYAGYCYYRQDTAMGAYLELVNQPFKCQQVFRQQIPECNENTPWADITCQFSLNQHCPSISRSDPDLIRHSEEYAYWESNFELFRAIPLVLFLLSSVIFYGARWAMTGRIKPLWLIRKL